MEKYVNVITNLNTMKTFEDYMGVHSDSYSGEQNLKRLFDSTATMLNDLAKNQESLENKLTSVGLESEERIDELEKKIEVLRCQCYSDDCLQCTKLKDLESNN